MNSMKEREYDIAVASSRLSKKWKNKKMSWRDIVKACSETTYTRETVAEYGRMTRDEQGQHQGRWRVRGRLPVGGHP